MKITSTLLREHDACRDHLAVFECLYPDGMDVTPENIVAARDAGLNVFWAADVLLPTKLWDEYERQRKTLYAEYLRQCTTLWDEYERQRAVVLTEIVKDLP